MPAPYEWALIDGLNDYYKAQRGNSGGASGDYESYDDDHDPRFPSASRGDVMASPEELMAFGMQYERS